MLLKRMTASRSSVTLALAVAVTALAHGQVLAPQLCDGEERGGTITQTTFCASSPWKDIAENLAVYYHPQIPICAECEDPWLPCDAGGIGFETEPQVVCYRSIISHMWTCCAIHPANNTFVQICSCEGD